MHGLREIYFYIPSAEWCGENEGNFCDRVQTNNVAASITLKNSRDRILTIKKTNLNRKVQQHLSKEKKRADA